MQRFVRGSTILFTATDFVDSAGASMTPTAVTLYIDYPTGNNCRSDTELTMTNASGTWTVEWERYIAEDGVVDYSCLAEGSDAVAKDGQFQLTANRANPDS